MDHNRLTIGPPLPPPSYIRGPLPTHSPTDDIIRKWNLAEETNKARRYRYESERYHRVIMSERTLEMRKAELSAIFQCFTVKEKVEKAKGSLIMADITNRSAVITLNPLKELRRSIDPEKGFHLTLNLERNMSQRLDLTVEEQIDQKSISSRTSCQDMFIAWASKLPRGSYLDEEATDKEKAAERSDVQSGGF